MKKNKGNKFYIRHGKKEDLKILDFIQSKNFRINNLPIASKEFLLTESIDQSLNDKVLSIHLSFCEILY